MKKFIILVIILLIIIFGIIIYNKDNSKNEVNLYDYDYSFNNETSKYEIYDDKGEIIFETQDRAEAEFYLDHPDYNAMIPGSSGEINSNENENFINSEENIQ